MHPIDWTIVVVYLVWMVYDGLRRTRASDQLEGYLLANRSLPWWAVGLSVMATQLSAITMVGTTGQGYADGLRFVQFYFGLPIAMVILSVTAVPFFHRARVFTAYEYLERRFDAKTRTLTSLLFLLSRGMSCGVIISAPAVILSVVLGWNLTITVLAIGLPTAAYTMLGGVQAITWTDVKQMVIIVVGLAAVLVALIVGLPDGVGLGDALQVAAATGRLDAIDFSFSFTETYTFWSGIIGGLFLMLSYFGCDQSQVQRYLTAQSIDAGRRSLLMSAYWKIPLQVLVLLVGVMVFVFYLFHQPPMLFNPVHEARVRSSTHAPQYRALEEQFQASFDGRRQAADQLARARQQGDSAALETAARAFTSADQRVDDVRARAAALVQTASGDAAYSDVNYIFPTFVSTHLPIGLIGIVIAAIFAAAMSSIAAELNALATTTVIDFYRRLVRPHETDRHYLRMSRLATAFWGMFACVVAMYATSLGSLIEVVNRFGSFFYGSILGVFMLAVFGRWAKGLGAFVGLIGGMLLVAYVSWRYPAVSFLWHNVIGALTVVAIGLTVSLFVPSRSLE
ncbi:MAG: sodium:solute symporter [Luteitalea sp.]|nr:sodium:solute symporter [Luteitalea sp.]